MPGLLDNGLVHVASAYSVAETVQRVEAALEAKNLTIFASVDHSGAAEKAGLTMKPTQLIIFGNAKGGTPLMIAAPTVAIDLPLKALVWEDADGKVWLSYNAPEYIERRHGVPSELVKNIAGAGAVLESAIK